MKKILLPLMAVAALLTACDEERYDAPQIQKGVTFTVPDFIEEAGTRVAVSVDNEGAHFTWTEGDTLGVFPSNGYQTAFPISGGAGTNTAVFDGADWALRPRASYAAYYPFVYEIKDKTAIEASYLGQTQDGNGSTAHLGNYDYLAAKYNTVSASGDVNFTLNHLGCLVRFQLTMPEADTYTSMTLSCDGSMLTTVGKFDLTAATPALTAKSQNVFLSLALENVATAEANEVLTLYMMLPPMDLSSKNLSIKVSGEKDYEATVAGKDMKAGSIYGYSNVMTTPALMHNGHEYVDLGLSVMWATCNVGASQPWDNGSYFSWGEISTKTLFDFNSYTYLEDGDWNNIKKYTIPDNRFEYSWYNGDVFIGDGKKILDSDDDAATANWGNSWRIPTNEENLELIQKCYWEYTDNYNNSGKKGYVIYKAKSSIDEGKIANLSHNPELKGEYNTAKDCHIFMPIAGYLHGDECCSSETVMTYWSSTLYMTGIPYIVWTTDKSTNVYNWTNWYTSANGMLVRPVYTNPNVIRITSIQITGEKTTLTPSETLQLSATVAPSDATNASVTWSSSNTSVATVSADGLVTAVATGSATITATANDGSGVKGEYEITVTAPALMHNGHEYVNLGLTSKGLYIYWATCNVGATKPEEYGDYFAWGETEPYYTEGHAQDNPCSNWKSGKSNGYVFSSYKYDSFSGITKYCTDSDYGTVDDKTVLEASDDAATANWGGSWRMPTMDELNDLRSNCTWNWTTKNGVNGYNVVGPNGNSIFLPAVGYRNGSYLDGAGSVGPYWSSSLDTYSPNACGLRFSSSDQGWYTDYRCYGRSVRPVCQ